MSADLFVKASRAKWRFASRQGLLTVEDLWDLPLKGRSGADLNSIAIELNNQIKGLTEESFVEPDANSPERETLTNQLELVKAVIAIRQEEAKAATDRAAAAALRDKLRRVIAAKEDEALQSSDLEDLRQKLAALEAV